jgi:hypothetical protein
MISIVELVYLLWRTLMTTWQKRGRLQCPPKEDIFIL